MAPVQFTWTDPTTNTDGSALQAGEVTGYSIGIRPASGVAGTYPTIISGISPTSTNELFSAIQPALSPGEWVGAIQTLSSLGVNSAWSNEAPFTIPAPTPVPNAPTGFSVA